MLRLALPVLLVTTTTACVVIADCPDGTCEQPGTRFRTVINTSFDDITVRQGPRHLAGIDCNDGYIREIDPTPSAGIFTIDSSTFRNGAYESGCALVVEAPSLTNIQNQGTGNITVEGGLRVAEILNTGSGTIRVKGTGNDGLLVRNTSVGDVRVDRAETDALTAINDGSGELTIHSLTSTTLRAENTSVGNLTIRDLDVAELSIEHSGSGTLFLQGSADVESAVLRGMGDVDAQVDARIVTARSTGSGDLAITAFERAEITLDGMGDILVRGQPRELFVRGNGSGDVLVER